MELRPESALGIEPLREFVMWATLQNPVADHTHDYQFIVALDGNVQFAGDSGVTSSFTGVPHTVEGTNLVTVMVRDITSPTRIVYPTCRSSTRSWPGSQLL